MNYLKTKRLFIWLIVGIVLLFLMPIFFSGDANQIISLFVSDYNDLWATISRSLIFSVLCTAICVFIGFWGGLFLKKIPLFSKYSYLITLLFIPFLLGDVSTAFIYKLFLNNQYAYNLYNTKYLTLLILISIQAWQFGSLYIYLFWMNFQSINEKKNHYFQFYGMNFYERIKDLYLPHSKNLIILTSLLIFVFSFYEEAKSSIIFKASQGAGTENISQWLYRNYRSEMYFNYDQAINKTLGFSQFIIIPILLVSVFLLISSINYVNSSFSKSKLYFKFDIKKTSSINPLSVIYLYLLLFLVLFPIIAVFTRYELSFEDLSDLSIALLYTSLTAILSLVVSVFFSYLLRVGWYKFMNEFNTKSLIVLSLLFLLLIVPPVSIMICGFKWVAMFGTSLNQYVLWIVGHILLCLPILTGFLLVSYFKIQNQELEYYMVYKVRSYDIFKFSFYKRFKLEYLLCLIFSFSIIWNESIINRVFSDDIPSFISKMMITLNSRKADFSVGLLYFSISCLLAISVVFLWNTIIKKNSKTVK